MPRFRKKPVEIEAMQWFETGTPHPGVHYDTRVHKHYVTTIHDQRAYLADGDWIIPEPKIGHYYPCKPDIFTATYDPVVPSGPAGDRGQVGWMGGEFDR